MYNEGSSLDSCFGHSAPVIDYITEQITYRFKLRNKWPLMVIGNIWSAVPETMPMKGSRYNNDIAFMRHQDYESTKSMFFHQLGVQDRYTRYTWVEVY